MRGEKKPRMLANTKETESLRIGLQSRPQKGGYSVGGHVSEGFDLKRETVKDTGSKGSWMLPGSYYTNLERKRG